MGDAGNEETSINCDKIVFLYLNINSHIVLSYTTHVDALEFVGNITKCIVNPSASLVLPHYHIAHEF